jgi:hypothetical protein
MKKFLVCHTREVIRYAWFTAETETEAIGQAQEADEKESDWIGWKGWETVDSDPGTFVVKEVDKEGMILNVCEESEHTLSPSLYCGGGLGTVQ